MGARAALARLLAASAALWLAGPAQALYANKDFFWPASAGGPVLIPVCWENAGAAPAARLRWARDAIESSWQRYARVNFVEWDACGAGDPGVHIRIADARPAAPGGVGLGGVTNGVTLNLSFDTFGPAACRASDAGRERCVRATAIHEFGHVLGFYHEEERPDYVAPPGTPAGDPCAKQSFANSSPQYYGAYDVDSVMSYCGQPGDSPGTWKTALSPGDVAAVQQAYGRRIPGSIVSPAGNCVASHAGAPNGEPAFLWDCDEAADDQEWRLAVGPGRLWLDGPSRPRCLESLSDPGAPDAYLYDCTIGRRDQRWKLEEAEVRGFGGLCLDLRGGDATTGTPIQVWQCGALGGANQKWTITPTGEIRFGGAGSSSCLTALPFARVFIAGCGLGAAQQFDLLAGGQLRLRQLPGQCLDVEGPTTAQYLSGRGLPANGQRVQAFPCLAAQLNQRWNLSGQIRHERTATCLERAGASEANGTGVGRGSCDGAAARRWDYYWR